MNQIRAKSPRIAPGELASQSQDISAQMAELRRRAEEKAEAEAQELAKKAAAEQQEIERLEAEKQQAQQEAQAKLAAAKAEAERQAAEMQLAAERQKAEQLAAERVAKENAEAERMAQQKAEAAKEISASEFIGQIASQQTVAPDAPIQDNNTAPKLVAKQVGDVPAVMQLANNTFSSQPVQDTQVRTVSVEENTDQTIPSIKLSAPALEVETYGPKTVGVTRPRITRSSSGTPARQWPIEFWLESTCLSGLTSKT